MGEKKKKKSSLRLSSVFFSFCFDGRFFLHSPVPIPVHPRGCQYSQTPPNSGMTAERVMEGKKEKERNKASKKEREERKRKTDGGACPYDSRW